MLESTSGNFKVEVNLQNVFNSPLKGDEISIEEDTWKSWFGIWLENLHPNIPEADAYELSLRLTNDEEILSLNRQYRHKNQPTDVLAFAALELEIPTKTDELLSFEPLYLGDLVISVPTASRQAKKYGHSLKIELVWLAAHGFLHLLGWDHPDEESLLLMLSQQEILLQLLGISCGNHSQ